MTTDLVQYGHTDPIEVGKVLAKSGFFADSRDAAQAAVKVMAGAELGIGPVQSMTGVTIIKGRVTLGASLIAGCVKRSGKYDYEVERHEETGCVLNFFELRGSQRVPIGTSSFTDEDAQRAGLSGDQWRKYRRNMHFARAVSNGAKWFCPDVFGGPIYTPEELGAEEAPPMPAPVAPAPKELPERVPEAVVVTPEPAPSGALVDQLRELVKASGKDPGWLAFKLVELGSLDVPAEVASFRDLGLAIAGLSVDQAHELAVSLGGSVLDDGIPGAGS